MGPLFKMLKKGQEFQWGPEQKEAFQNTKNGVTANPVLAQFNPDKETTIETDASDYTVGMRMTQPGIDGKPQSIVFHSRKLV